MLGLAPPQQYRREVQVLHKKEGGEKMPKKSPSHAPEDWSLLNILCDVQMFASHAPTPALQLQKLHHHSSLKPPALLLYFPWGAWGAKVKIWLMSANCHLNTCLVLSSGSCYFSSRFVGRDWWSPNKAPSEDNCQQLPSGDVTSNS